jgi:predicted transcriptional regulator
LVGELMREFIERQRAAREHDAWFRAEVEQGLREADDPNVELIDHEEVMKSLERLLEEHAKTAGAEAG